MRHVQEQLANYERRFHISSDCDQFLFAKQQPVFNYDTISSLLSMIHASVKSYHSAFLELCMINLFSFPVLLKCYLPMSPIPMESRLEITDSVSLRQSNADDRLNFSITASDLLSSCAFRLLADFITVSKVLLLPPKILLASLQTVLTPFEEKTYSDGFSGQPSSGSYVEN